MTLIQLPPPAAAVGTGRTGGPQRQRRRPDLTLHLPQRDLSLAVPLPLPPTFASSSSAGANIQPNNQHPLTFSDLEKVNRVGSGASGTVYKVLHKNSGRIYALKVIYGNHEEAVRRQIRREIEILRSVDNPNVVKCLDMFDHNGEIQVLLEFMDGGSLESKHIPSEPALAELARQVLSGLLYLHRRRIVHRDIKPSNLLINCQKHVKIADFGVSRILSQTMDPCNFAVGTIAYRSPERINTDLNHGRYDGYAGDIWSLGVSILEFYLGRIPFSISRQGDWASLMCAICLAAPPEAPPTASRKFRDFISRCLQREPERRWTAAQLLGHPFIVQNTAGPADHQNEDMLLSDSIMEKMKDYCSIFFLLPEEYEFERDTLIQIWMARGYNKDELMGHECFHFLLNQECLSSSGTNFVTKKDKFQINMKKIKELLDGQRDNGNSYLKWENECQKNINSTHIQHVSLVCNDINASTFRTLQEFSELRTLLFLRNYGNKVPQIPDNLFQSFTELRTLDLSRTHIKKLPSSVGYMIHLHYVDLSWTLIEWLPDIICSLEELQTLKLMGCSKLRGLPRQLKKLTKLRHLDVDVRQLATVLKGIGALVNLQTLSAFLVGTEEGCKIQELKELNSLTGDFCIAMLENVGSAEEAKAAALNRKQHINKLELRWSASQLSRKDNNCYDVLDSLLPFSSLEELQIFCYEGSMFPDWVSDPKLDQLVNITFFKCEHVSELPLMEQLPFLKKLELVKMNGVKKIERRGKPEQVVFSSLEKLEIDEMQSLEVWSWVKTNEGDFKSLVELTINDCPELHEFHVFPCLSSIKRLEVRGCPKLESLSETKLPDSLEELIVEDCPRIKKRCSREGDDWHKIKHVSNIHICMDDDDDDDEDEC